MKHPVDELIQRLYRNSDNELLQEFNAAEREAKVESGPQPDSEGFERLWSKVIKEHEKGGHC